MPRGGRWRRRGRAPSRRTPRASPGARARRRDAPLARATAARHEPRDGPPCRCPAAPAGHRHRRRGRGGRQAAGRVAPRGAAGAVGRHRVAGSVWRAGRVSIRADGLDADGRRHADARAAVRPRGRRQLGGRVDRHRRPELRQDRRQGRDLDVRLRVRGRPIRGWPGLDGVGNPPVRHQLRRPVVRARGRDRRCRRRVRTASWRSASPATAARSRSWGSRTAPPGGRRTGPPGSGAARRRRPPLGGLPHARPLADRRRDLRRPAGRRSPADRSARSGPRRTGGPGRLSRMQPRSTSAATSTPWRTPPRAGSALRLERFDDRRRRSGLRRHRPSRARRPPGRPATERPGSA